MKTHSATRLVHSCWLIAAALSCLAGCAQLNVKGASAIPFWPDDGNTPRVPVKVATVWVDTVRFTQGAAPARGFGGRLVFYDNKHEDPVKVDGDLVIYAFDEDNRQPGDPRPDRKYVFTAEQLPIHYSQSKLGHSYSFFLPWDEPGGPRKEISLIARFRPKRADQADPARPTRAAGVGRRPPDGGPDARRPGHADLAPIGSCGPERAAVANADRHDPDAQRIRAPETRRRGEREVYSGRVFGFGGSGAGPGAAGSSGRTTNSFLTDAIAGSRSANCSARTRSCSVATAPRSVAIP